MLRLELDGRTIFQDTMLHLVGSLASLGKSYGLEIEKGHFPHLFNRPENLDYIGPIPSLEFFDTSFMMSDEKSLREFKAWYASWGEKEWNFKNELERYCINDVSMLAKIALIYHTSQLSILKKFPHLQVSPWQYPTVAGYVHKIMIRQLHFENPLAEIPLGQFQAYAQTTWCTLEEHEHYFAKLAFRGGRTDIRKYYHQGPIAYKDIQSHYPATQLSAENLFPVGTPIIEIHDEEYYPCFYCYVNPMKLCSHTYQHRKDHIQRLKKKLVIEEVKPLDLHAYIENFDGFITVDVTPNPTLYHPVLVIYDSSKMKCVAPNTKIVKQTFATPELKRAIQMGYTVTKIYRADRYKMAPSIWRTNKVYGEMYLAKMMASGKAPIGEAREIMRKTFMDKFNINLGTDVEMDKWEKNNVLKKVSKGPLNSAWGKHGESTDHPQNLILASEGINGEEFYKRVYDNNFKLKNALPMGENSTFFNFEAPRPSTRPDLHKGYLPVAVFVTSYARLKLWEEMNKLDERVLMHDTDSIIYSIDENEYDIPEGDCLGDWETEDFQKDNGGLVEFVAIGPKSYGLKGGNGKTFIKIKGVSIKYAHSEIINFDVMKEIVLIEKQVHLPQNTLDYKHGQYMWFRQFLKSIRFNQWAVKGDYDLVTTKVYPYGYISSRDLSIKNCQGCNEDWLGQDGHTCLAYSLE